MNITVVLQRPPLPYFGSVSFVGSKFTQVNIDQSHKMVSLINVGLGSHFIYD